MGVGVLSEDRVPPYYDRDFVERELSVEAIAEQARLLLFRALNIGRAVGFIGSGLSSAYGRPTWSKLVNDLKDYSNAIVEQAEKSADRDEQGRLGALKSTAEKVSRAAPAGVSDPDVLPLRAQLYRSLTPQDGGEDLAQRFIKRVTCNDDYVAFSSWSEFYPQNEKAQLWKDDLEIDKKWRRVDTIASVTSTLQMGRAACVDPARVAAWRALEAAFANRRQHAEATSDAARTGAGRRASAEERFLTALVLAEMAGAEPRKLAIEWLLKSTDGDEELGDDADARRGRTLDPIRILFEDLRIRRVLTTNYDFELEMGLERLGFEPGKLRPNPKAQAWSDASRRGELTADRPLGDRARSLVFKRETAADLTNFAVRAQTANEFEIFHLHGRAICGADERLVVTERDYQETYLRNSPEAHVMDEALTAAMGGNPIVFLGMGMMEADLLRPLRRFVAGPRAQFNRSIIAVMPTEESVARRTKTAIQLYLRYGVHIIYYDGAEAKRDPVTGRCCCESAAAAPWGYLERERRANNDKDNDDALLFLSIERLIAVRRLLETEPKTLAAYLRDNPDEDPFDVVIECLEQCAPPGAPKGCHIVAALGVAREMLRDDAIASDPDRVRHLRDFLTHVDGRVRARALCKVMREIGDLRRDWWRKWREQPRVRTYKHVIDELVEEDGERKWQSLGGREYQPFLRKDAPNPIRSVRYQVKQRPRDVAVEAEEKAADVSIEAAIAAITERPEQSRRRIFIVHGDLGAGRGQFFHELSERFARRGRGGKHAAYQWGLFTNATFSTEYSSVIDGVNNFLWRCSSALSDPPRGKLRSRRDAVAFHLRRLYSKKGAGDKDRRGLLLIGGAELLFRSRDGTAKNVEIVEALSALLSKEQNEYPIDIVICCRREKCRQIFGKSFDRAGPDGVAEDLRFGKLPKGTRAPPFSAILLALKAPDVAGRIDARLGSDETIREVLGDVPRNRIVGRLASKVSDDLKRRIEVLQRDDWRKAMQARFGGAIILDCAVETFNRAYAISGKRDVDGAVAAVAQFLTSLGDLRSRVNERGGTDLAIAAVLSQYERLDRHYPALDSAILPDLCTRLLKHLSIICAPMEIVVFLRCPEVADYLKQHLKERDSDDTRLEVLRKQLNWLEEHSLIFRIRSRSEMDGDGEGSRFARYVSHQSLQGYFFHRIGSAHIELGDSRLFTVSVYPTQSVDAPTPSFETYQFLTKLLRKLISYPTSRLSAEAFTSEEERRTAACALRAGVSLTRSAFSMAVVSRFSEYALERKERGAGFMEEYRLLLRWMIFRAGMIGIAKLDDDPAAARLHVEALAAVAPDKVREKLLAPPADKQARDRQGALFQDLHQRSRFNALYQDEVTWLYNECALVSYAQGNIPDALALYNQALESNKMVETKTENGPNALRIRLNRAICEIDRGGLDRANEELRTIWEQFKREPVIAATARGYMGLVAQLKRRVDQARTYYDEAIKILRKYGESRALAIVQRHYGDLERGFDLKRARVLLSAALAEAETSRQQDLVHRVRVSIARCDLAGGPGHTRNAGAVLRRLDDVMRYADVMEIHSLKVDALLARSLGISHQGETRTAGDHAVTALSLSTLYGQSLRAVYALTRLGALISARPGYEGQGRRLLASASGMAETYNYQPARESIGARLADLGEEQDEETN
ncbi:MAG: SIR2 family protein [Terricaulis sp.]